MEYSFVSHVSGLKSCVGTPCGAAEALPGWGCLGKHAHASQLLWAHFGENIYNRLVSCSKLSQGNLSIPCCPGSLVLAVSKDLIGCVLCRWSPVENSVFVRHKYVSFPHMFSFHCFSFSGPSSLSPYPLLPKQACLLWPTFWLSFLRSSQLSKPKVLLKCMIVFHKFLVGVPVKIQVPEISCSCLQSLSTQ